MSLHWKGDSSFFFLNLIYLFLVVLSLCCCTGFSLVAGSGGYLLVQCMGFSLQWFLLWSSGSRVASVVVAPGL